MNLKEEILKYDNYDLPAFADAISNGSTHRTFVDENNLSEEEVRDIILEVVRELMRRNLVIPKGSTIDMTEIAEHLSLEPEFKDKYDEPEGI